MNLNPTYIAATALGISLLSLIISFMNFNRDKAQIVATSKFYNNNFQESSPHLTVRITNHGRRTSVIRMMGGTVAKNKWSATYLNDQYNGYPLTENQYFEREYYRDDLFYSDPEGEFGVFKELWVEDSLGKKHSVKYSKKNIKKVFDAYGDVDHNKTTSIIKKVLHKLLH